jgi:hypothetical protein
MICLSIPLLMYIWVVSDFFYYEFFFARFITAMNKCFLFSLENNFFLLLCWVGVHCGIYKSSYNVSNILYTLLYFPSPHSWNGFNRYIFCVCTHVYTFFCFIFTLLLPFPITSPTPF